MKYVARILTKDGQVAGVGFRISQQSVLSAGHVLERATNMTLPRNRVLKHGEPIALDFPLTNDQKKFYSRVAMRVKEDVGTLEVDGVMPEEAKVAVLDIGMHYAVGRTLRVFGFPDSSSKQGIFVRASIAGQQGDLLNVVPADFGPFIEPGFSGAPVVDEETDLVLGMVVRVDADRKTALVVNSAFLQNRILIEHLLSPGEKGWKVMTLLCKGILTAFLDDVSTLEEDGLTEEECQSVQGCLGKLCNAASSLASAGDIPIKEEDFRSLVYQPLENMRKAYVEWNGVPHGKQHAHMRAAKVAEIRQHRGEFTQMVQRNRGSIIQTLENDTFDSFFRDLKKVTTKYPGKFENMRRSLRALATAQRSNDQS